MSDIKLACDMAEQIKTICDKHGNKPGELINILSVFSPFFIIG